MLIFLSITVIFLYLITVPITVKMSVAADLFDNDGKLTVKLGFIKVFAAEAYIKQRDIFSNSLMIKTGKGEIELHLNADKKDEKSIIRLLQIEFIPYINIKYIGLDVSIGKRDDAFFTTMALGAARSAIYCILAYFKNKQIVDISESFSAEYNRDAFNILFDGIIDISIADIIFSLILFIKHKISAKGGQKVDNRA